MSAQLPTIVRRNSPPGPAARARQRRPAGRLGFLLLCGWVLLLSGPLALALPRPTAQSGPTRPGVALPRFTIQPYLQDVTTSGLIIAWATDQPTTGVVRIFDGEGQPPPPGLAQPQGEALPPPPELTDAESAPPPTAPFATGSEPPSPLEPLDPEATPGPFADDLPSEPPPPSFPQSAATTTEPPTRAQFLSPPGQLHRVRIQGLRPGTRYRYVVAIHRPGDPQLLTTTTPLAELTTASLRGPFVFLVYGDTRDRDADHAAVVHAMLAEHPDFIIQTGDMVSRASEYAQWRRYFGVASPLLRSVPLYPALGNHELRGDPEARNFHRLFSLPGRSAQSHRRRAVYYSFRFSNSLFVAIDGNSPYDNEQSAWLERTLHSSQADASIRHIFAFVHQPPFAVGAYCGSERLVRRIVPILQRYGVRAVFAGHEHAYQHLERAGLRYFISGGGGAPLYFRSQACTVEDDMSLRLFRAEHHYLQVAVHGDAATLLAIDRRGTIMERVELQDPVPESPPPAAPFPYDEPRQWHPQPRPHDAPLLGLSTAAPTALTKSAPPSQPGSSGPLVLFWLCTIALLAGLIVLTRDLRPPPDPTPLRPPTR